MVSPCRAPLLEPNSHPRVVYAVPAVPRMSVPRDHIERGGHAEPSLRRSRRARCRRARIVLDGRSTGPSERSGGPAGDRSPVRRVRRSSPIVEPCETDGRRRSRGRASPRASAWTPVAAAGRADRNACSASAGGAPPRSDYPRRPYGSSSKRPATLRSNGMRPTASLPATETSSAMETHSKSLRGDQARLPRGRGSRARPRRSVDPPWLRCAGRKGSGMVSRR